MSTVTRVQCVECGRVVRVHPAASQAALADFVRWVATGRDGRVVYVCPDCQTPANTRPGIVGSSVIGPGQGDWVAVVHQAASAQVVDR